MNIKSVSTICIVLILLFGFQNCGVVGGKFKAQQLASLVGNNQGSSAEVGSPNGKAFFESAISPQLKSTCLTCHKEGSQGGSGPTRIFDYTTMFLKLKNGTTQLDNELLKKVKNEIPHTGGNQCSAAGNESPICKLMIEWWNREFKAPASSDKDLVAEILNIDSFGKVYGYAMLNSMPSEKLQISLYIDGIAGTGQFQLKVDANLVGNGGTFGGHYFEYQLPDKFREGVSHTLYAYAGEETSDRLIKGNGKTFVAYTFSTAGRNYFDTNLKPIFAKRCVSCHSATDSSYENRFMALLNPTPAAGGTAVNNLIIRKLSGSTAHSGGNICGSVSNSPCSLIQEWWGIEFK